MTITRAEFRGLLERVQDNAPSNPHTVSRWLDAHERDVLRLLSHKGPELTADFLGIMAYTLEKWRERRRRRKERMKALEVVRHG